MAAILRTMLRENGAILMKPACTAHAFCVLAVMLASCGPHGGLDAADASSDAGIDAQDADSVETIDPGVEHTWVWHLGSCATERYGTTIAESADGGFVYAGSRDAGWLARLDLDGNVLWQRTITGTISDMDNGLGVAETSGKDVVLAISGYGFEVLRFGADGELRWGRALEPIYARSVIAGDHDEAIVTGCEDSMLSTSYNMWMAALDASGDYLWQKAIASDVPASGKQLIRTRDGGVLGISAGCGDSWIVKLAPDGAFAGECPLLQSTSDTPDPTTKTISPASAAPVDTDLAIAAFEPEITPVVQELLVVCSGG